MFTSARMLTNRGWRVAGALLALAGCAGLAGCESSIAVSAAANVPARYSHVWVTVEQVWLNASATAGPEDAGWLEFPLSTPETLDLVNLTSGALSEFAGDLPAPPGTYKQLRLILSESSGTLLDSAQTAGARFNNEVDYFDSAGTEQRQPLAVANAAQGVGIPIELEVLTPSSAILAALGSTSTSATNSNSTTGTSGTTSTGTTTGTSTGTTTGTTTSTSSTTTTGTSANRTSTITAKAAVVFDAARDIAPFKFSDQPGFVLNSTLTGQDLAKVGTIRSQITISTIPADTNTGRPDIQVTAETPNSDSTRNVVVMSAPVRSDGSFVLYPFPMTSTSPTTYDLVIHGPKVQTVIIKAVPVSSGTPTSATTVSLGNLSLVAATSYAVNVAEANPVSPRGARVGFYQTLSGSGELPYVIEERTIDPISGLFADDQAVSSATIASGKFVSGQSPVLTTAAPTEGAGAYRVSATAPVYGDGVFGATIAPPASGTTTTVTFTGPEVNVPSAATSGTITATLNIASPGRYDKGVLVVTHDGAVVAVTPLDAVLAQATGTVTLSSVPGGSATQTFDAGVYYSEVWVWNSNNPTGTFSRQPSSTVIDLRTTSTATATLSIT